MTVTKQQVLDALADRTIEGDGHTIFYPSKYEAHFPVRDWNLVQTYESDGTGKGTIFGENGEIIPSVEGVYNLTFLRVLARKCGIEYSPYSMGRGSEAREWVQQIIDWANSPD